MKCYKCEKAVTTAKMGQDSKGHRYCLPCAYAINRNPRHPYRHKFPFARKNPRRSLGACDCSDPGCPVHKGKERCKHLARYIVYRSDMEDETGTPMCQRCMEDAMDSGVFYTKNPRSNPSTVIEGKDYRWDVESDPSNPGWLIHVEIEPGRWEWIPPSPDYYYLSHRAGKKKIEKMVRDARSWNEWRKAARRN